MKKRHVNLHKISNFKYTIIFILLLMPMAIYLQSGISTAQEGDQDNDFNVDSIIQSLPKNFEFDETINQQWYHKDYKMLLILPPNQTLEDNGEDPQVWYEKTKNFIEWKQARGLPSLIINNYTDYEGVDEPEKIRNAIKSHHQKHPSIEWVLLLGDPDLLPMRYVYNPDQNSVVPHRSEAVGDSFLKPTDMYYADLSGNWDIDGDGTWGEYKNYVSESELSETDFVSEVYVGRFPVKTKTQLQNIFDKTKDYERGVNAGDWMNRYLAVSAISDYPYSGDTNGEDEAPLNQYILDNYIDGEMNWIHLLESTEYYTPPERLDPEGNSRIEQLNYGEMPYYLDFGCSISVFAGHGAPSYFSTKTAGHALDTGDVSSLENYGKPTFLFGDACSTNAYDYSCLGESFVLKENAGGIGFVGSLRISWYYPNDTYFQRCNRGLTKLYFKEMFGNGYYEQGKALYESKKTYINQDWYNSENAKNYIEVERKQMMGYMLLGDPSVKLYTQEAKNITGIIEDGETFYSSSVKSFKISDDEGNPLKDVNLIISSQDGSVYKKFVSDYHGNIKVQFPNKTGQFEYTIYGHNVKSINGTFNLGRDDVSPLIDTHPRLTPEIPTVSENTQINVTAYDSLSGVGVVYLILSNNSYENFQYYQFNSSMQSAMNYSLKLPKLKPDTYSWGLVVFDISNNYNSSFSEGIDWHFSIYGPVQENVYSMGTYGLVGVVGLAISFFTYQNIRSKENKGQSVILNDGKSYYSANDQNKTHSDQYKTNSNQVWTEMDLMK